jgi:hypothetical protein
MYMKRIIAILLLLAPALFAQTSTASAADVQALKDALAAQQQQIQQLSQQLQRQQDGQQAQIAATDAAKKAAAAPTQASPQRPTVAELKGDANFKTGADNTAPTAQEAEPSVTSELEGPLTIRFKGVSITPGGFVAAEFVRRSRALGADVTTPFNSLPLPGASQSKESEFFGSARQSRPTVYFLAPLKNVELSSYISGDFLSAGNTSTSTQTNSYTFRLRQAWGQAKFNNGWSFLGGQAWSLVTENKSGIRPSDDAGKTNDARPSTIDSGYNVGFSFARQYGLRVTKDFGKKVWLAVAIENPEATLTTHGNADNFLLGEVGDGKSYNSGANYSFNPSPDIIAKAAFDPGFGHYEVFGLFDRFTDRVFPCGEVASAKTLCGGSTTPGVNVLGAYNASKNGGGFGANARWNFAHKHVVFGLHGFGGSGVGRYGAGQLSDLAIGANGTVNLIRGYQGLTSIEWHGSKLDVYLYGGAEYASRTAQTDPITGKEVGYGAPLFVNSGCNTETLPTVNTGFTPGTLANCTGDTRALIEGTGGFWYRFYNGPKGRFQFGTQYSYVTRNTWSGVGGAPHGIDGMVFTSFRYYLP